ncbi:MAG: NAD-dependent epimerase/dehydratase family protein [Candidatus Thermoplasmatota archaeon]|nr:NAD-dependent epimerase/dehydratase family protein [Candidatus Thermoplasmatota archaeon]
MKNILVTGALGQIGSELVVELRKKYGRNSVVASDLKTPDPEVMKEGPYEIVDVTSRTSIENVVDKHKIDTIFHLAAILSAKGEQNPQLAFNVNIIGMYNVLEVGRDRKIQKIIVPSSIAAFGPDTPKDNTPNETILRPSTMYGVSKVAGELLGNYYFTKYGLDVRGVRFPGIISWKTPPGGGTTDYAVAIFYDAIKYGKYECFVREDTVLPMMYMPDAIKVLMDLAEADIKNLKHHCDYNVAAMSFSAKELAAEIQKIIPELKVTYKPDFRQKIADSWPRSLDDSAARNEWGWKPEYDIKKMTEEMIRELKKKLK